MTKITFQDMSFDEKEAYVKIAERLVRDEGVHPADLERRVIEQMKAEGSLSDAGEPPAQIPPLEVHCGSWVISHPDGTIICETFEAHVAQKAMDKGLVVRTTAEHLSSLNEEVQSQ